ncbi:hypothetical protein BDBG_05076 [Blastomyces gilchristii SLH14081]|uniref:Uncharacterized protein n=1 Tax=Blastomyces gilchristii (strain SLH14081) TaxID=559298 RepID=A0A179UMG3_BLAGS|nr:uncharacterized protein BDBG_05076 [Blastomyces gilchristii SLH14081]OAT09266.1 hypothetical protein BDBG_05076 [Blastomyces gilchristii SLH14081]
MAAVNSSADKTSDFTKPHVTAPVNEIPATPSVSEPQQELQQEEQHQHTKPGIHSTEAKKSDTTNSEENNEWRLKSKKSVESSAVDKSESQQRPSNIPNPITTMRPVSPLNSLSSTQPSASPHRARNPYMSPSSPNRGFRSASPRLHSPASSQIFERSVQEDFAPAQASPSIPSHIMTENHIPPILGASSAALTDERLDPDSVEIITHNFHQPASLSVTGGQPEQAVTSSWHEDLNPHLPPDAEDSVSNYGGLDPSDIRRLSFVSFADVVNGEHAETDHASNRDSMYMAGLSTNAALFAAQNRSPSPVRSPVSSHGFGTSPPTSVSPSTKGLDNSPNRGGWVAGSPRLCGHSPPPGTFGGELNVETMRQALRRTGSGDFGGFRSQPMSAVGNDDGTYDRPFK